MFTFREIRCFGMLHCAVIIMVFSTGSCLLLGRKQTSTQPDTETRSSTEERKITTKPIGNEIGVELVRAGPRLAVITVTNLSSNNVYLPYLPSPNTEVKDVPFALVGLEKRDPKTGEFRDAERTDFGPGSRPLPPGASFEYHVNVPTSGEYRVNIRYAISEEWSSRINAAELLEGEERIRESKAIDAMMDDFVATVSEGPIEL